MFEEYQELLTDLEENINSISEFLDITEDRVGLLEALREVVGEALLRAGIDAINRIPEFNYEPLKERFIENLSRIDKHVVINGRNLLIFDEDFAGTVDDLISGQESAGGHTGTYEAPAVWKYGIYKPFFGEGTGLSKALNLPDYGTIIAQRLSAWGERAPFWYFIENGNLGLTRAYPTFPGTSFIAAIRAKVPDLIQQAIDLFALRAVNDLSIMADEFLNVNPKSRTRVTLFKYTVAGRNVSLQKSSAGNFFYRIGNVTYGVEEFKSAIRALLQ